MKIIYIDPQSYNNLADYDKYLLENIEAQKIFICSTNMPYNEIKNTRIIMNYDYHTKKSIFKILSYIISQKKLIQIIKNEKPDVIHFQWFKIPQLDIVLLKRIKKILPKVKVVHTAHNVLPHDSGSKYKRIYKKIYSTVDSIIVHAEITRSDINKEFNISKEKIVVIPHGFLPTKYKFQKTPSENSVITFSFIGFLSDYKGLDILLEAWCGCPEILDNKTCRLIIAGAGDLNCLHSIPLGKNIIIENYFHNEEDLAKIISETDVAVLPYKRISQSGVLLTYLAEHIPVLVSNIGGLTQPFEIANVGWVLENLNSQCLTDRIMRIIEKKEELRNIKDNLENWKKIDEFYDWKSIGNTTLKLYSIK